MPFANVPDVEPILRSPSKKKPCTCAPFCAISKRNGTSTLFATTTASHRPVIVPAAEATGRAVSRKAEIRSSFLIALSCVRIIALDLQVGEREQGRGDVKLLV